MSRPVFSGTSLMSLAFSAPLVGIRLRWPNVLHAVEMEGLPIKTWPDGLAKSVCGKSGLRLLGVDEGVVPWPPYVKGLGERTRCPECYRTCKVKQPRARFVAAPTHGKDGTP